MKLTLYEGNVLDSLKQMPDESVDCIVTSPPYYGLRSYNGAETIWGGNTDCEHEWKSTEIHKVGQSDKHTTRTPIQGLEINAKIDACYKCDAWKGQLGLEPTYSLYLDHLMLIISELKRVLKKTGTLFWNMGDSYASSGGPSRHSGYPDPKFNGRGRNSDFEEPTSYDQGILPKSLMMLPERLAIRMIDNGWILRNKMIWYKRNGMPSSVKDRLSNKHEIVYFFVKSQKYYFNLDAIRKPLNNRENFQQTHSNAIEETINMDNGNETLQINADSTNLNGIENSNIQMYKGREKALAKAQKLYPDNIEKQKDRMHYIEHFGSYEKGINPGDVLDIPTKPHAFAHFAVFPETLVTPFIKAGCPTEVCSQCGKPKMPSYEQTGRRYKVRTGEYSEEARIESKKIMEATGNNSPSSVFSTGLTYETITVWKPSCNCNAPFIPGTAMDPFAGSGTVGVVARKLNRSAVLCEIGKSYIEIIKKRLLWGTGLDVEYEIKQNDDQKK